MQRLALAAYTAVYQQHHRGLLRYARTLTGDRHLAEDLVAEAHLRVWQRIAAGHRIDDPRAYLATTVRNLATAPREAADPLPAAPGSAPGADPADRVAEVARLRDLLGRLPERWAQVLWPAEVEDLPLEEVGARLGLRRNAAGVLLHRAREGLRTAYLGDYPGAPADPECAAYWAVIPPLEPGRAPGGGASPPTTAGGPEQAPDGGCEVGYLITSQWEGRFVVRLRIRNTGPGAVAGWNARIDPGRAVDSGFEGSWAGENPAPAVMYLNGTACTVVPE
ncbi:hypothetical protein GCM10023235_29980 [Kitasatospora terrestris]|uniref:CBM2 domain-containing protein n=1 Tax=Kitasatospora terrestris TaxID=258051 RepID=A0ABP9DN08_9ACTN